MVVKNGVVEISVSSRAVTDTARTATIAGRIIRMASFRCLGDETLVFRIVKRVLIPVAEPKF